MRMCAEVLQSVTLKSESCLPEWSLNHVKQACIDVFRAKNVKQSHVQIIFQLKGAAGHISVPQLVRFPLGGPQLRSWWDRLLGDGWRVPDNHVCMMIYE